MSLTLTHTHTLLQAYFREYYVHFCIYILYITTWEHMEGYVLFSALSIEERGIIHNTHSPSTVQYLYVELDVNM